MLIRINLIYKNVFDHKEKANSSSLFLPRMVDLTPKYGEIWSYGNKTAKYVIPYRCYSLYDKLILDFIFRFRNIFSPYLDDYPILIISIPKMLNRVLHS